MNYQEWVEFSQNQHDFVNLYGPSVTATQLLDLDEVKNLNHFMACPVAVFNDQVVAAKSMKFLEINEVKSFLTDNVDNFVLYTLVHYTGTTQICDLEGFEIIIANIPFDHFLLRGGLLSASIKNDAFCSYLHNDQ
jgi:hypothetical protein